jgi:hypothetical protein
MHRGIAAAFSDAWTRAGAADFHPTDRDNLDLLRNRDTSGTIAAEDGFSQVLDTRPESAMSSSEYFHRQAATCHRMAHACFDLAVAAQLGDMAEEFENKARDLERAMPQCGNDSPSPRPRPRDSSRRHS